VSETATKALLGMSLEELTGLAVASGQPPYRGQQLFDALYSQRVESLDQITTLPLPYRLQLVQQGWRIGLPSMNRKFVSSDGTIRYLMGLADGETVETVWMPEGDGGEAGDGTDAGDEESEIERGDPAGPPPNPAPERRWRRATICVSSQVGCALNCRFCLTALLGVKRNLTAGEIVGQIAAVLRDRAVHPPLDRVNIVFMGMGEPFLNYENFMKAARLLVEGLRIPDSRMTVSTAGVVPRIADFGREAVRPKLAISLNAPNDTLRNEIMPHNRKWNLEALLQAAREFPLRPRERLTFEYVLLSGVNDTPEHARQVACLIRDMRAKVNLIALNPGPASPGLARGGEGPDLPYRTPERDCVTAFQKVLTAANIPTFVRRPRGRDIFAACGQLKRTLEIAPAS